MSKELFLTIDKLECPGFNSDVSLVPPFSIWQRLEWLRMRYDPWYLYAVRELEYDIKRGNIQLPQVKHDNPADYGISEKEAINIKMRYLRSLKKLCTSGLATAKTSALRYYNWHSQWQLLIAQKELEKIDRRIRHQLDRLKELKAIKQGLPPPKKYVRNLRTDYDLEQIKKVPCNLITEINSAGFFIKNPFRNERSPSNSLHWNKTTNRWTDYGSGEHGDNLDLYMKINDCDLPTACKDLMNIG